MQKEDHTLGNTVRMQLHRDPNVVFAGYQVPHPSDNRVSSVRAATAPRRVVAVRPSLRASGLFSHPASPLPRTAADPRANPPNPQVQYEQRLVPHAGDDGGREPGPRCVPRGDDHDETRWALAPARCVAQRSSPTTTDLPLRLSPIHQVSDLSDKFKDEVAAFKSNQGGIRDRGSE